MKITDLAHKLEPFILQMIEEYMKLHTDTGTSGGGAFLPREHAIWLLDSGGAAIKDYTADSNGFDGANAEATSGDIIWVPACTVAGDKGIDEGVKVVGASRYATIFSGKFTLDTDSSIENLTVIRSEDEASTIIAVVAPDAEGKAYINNCDVKATNAGAGDARGVQVDDVADLECWNSYLYGNSSGGDGFGGYPGTGETGELIIHGGRVRGSEDYFNEATNVYTYGVRLG